MNIEAVCSIIVLVGVAFFVRYLYKSGKEIQQRQRELEENRAKTSSSKSD